MSAAIPADLRLWSLDVLDAWRGQEKQIRQYIIGSRYNSVRIQFQSQGTEAAPDVYAQTEDMVRLRAAAGLASKDSALGDVASVLAARIFIASDDCYEYDRLKESGHVLSFARPFGPSKNGSARCKSGSIASGGTSAYCTCDSCF